MRLGFLGLAEDDNGLPKADVRTASERESMSMQNGQEVPWRRAPLFEPAIKMSAASPRALQQVHTTRLASELRQMFGISVEREDYGALRRSFWSLDELDDRQPDWQRFPPLFGNLSPAVPTWRLDLLDDPRDYVSLLLGGGTNRWSNVDFAAAFGTVVTGRPVIARAVPGDTTIDPAARISFEPTALQLRDALRDVVTSGTASSAFGKTGESFRKRGVSVYAKTGTLSTDKARTETSRLVVALVRWRGGDDVHGEVAGGVVLSLVVERADAGFAARWLNEFVVANQDKLLRYVQAPVQP